MKCHCGLLTFLAVGLFLAVPIAAHAAMTGYWPLEAGSGSTAFNLGAGGMDSWIFNAGTGGLGAGGQAWITGDPVRGTVLSFNGDDGAGAYVDAGDIPPMDLTTDYTWSFWANQDSGGSGGNDVILGNRYRRGGGDDTPRQFIKFTPTQFEYHVTSGENIDYADIPDGQWIHHAVVKSGDTLTYYRDGTQAGQRTVTLVHDLAHPFYIGGDAYGERWRGLIDDVAIFDEALTEAQIQTIMGGDFSDFLVPLDRPGTFQFIPVTNDADSDISADKIYSHAVDSGTGGPAVVNGVGFIGARTSQLPLATFNYEVDGGSLSEHDGNDNHNVSGSVVSLFRDFFYNGSNPAGNTATVTLTGLVPGAVYDTRLYARQWDPDTIRQATVGFDINNDGTPDNWVLVDENHASSVGFADDNQAYAISYTFQAESDQLNITLQQALSNQSWHLYGLTNEIVQPAPGTAPVSGLVSADNHYQLYLSDDDSVLGTPIAQSDGGVAAGNPDDWRTTETVGFLVPDGQPMYLHVVVQNDDPPGWGGLIANFEVPAEYRILLPDGTRGTTLETNDLLWMVNDTGFGDPMVAATAVGGYGTAPWGTSLNPAMPGTAQWIWLGGGQGQPAGTLYFSAPVTAYRAPEPGTLALLALGAVGLLVLRRRRARR